MKVAIYPGTFDPITNGHLDILARALKVFDVVVVAVLNNPLKRPLFSIAERLEMIKSVTDDWQRVKVVSFESLTVNCARAERATAIIRGLRALSDFEYEFQMALMNRNLAPDIETVFLMPSEPYTYLSSGVVKEIVQFGGDVRQFVPPLVEKKLRERLLSDQTRDDVINLDRDKEL